MESNESVNNLCEDWQLIEHRLLNLLHLIQSLSYWGPEEKPGSLTSSRARWTIMLVTGEPYHPAACAPSPRLSYSSALHSGGAGTKNTTVWKRSVVRISRVIDRALRTVQEIHDGVEGSRTDSSLGWMLLRHIFRQGKLSCVLLRPNKQTSCIGVILAMDSSCSLMNPRSCRPGMRSRRQAPHHFQCD